VRVWRDVKSCPACKANYPAKTPRCPLDGSALVDVGPDLLAGRVLCGRYRLVDRCGAGPTAEVYRTHDVRTGSTVALRIPSPTLGGDPWYRARIQLQVQAFKRAAPHDALVPALDVIDGGFDGRTLIVTEFVKAPSLPHVLIQGPVHLAAALDAGIQLAALLEHLHDRDVLARDLRAGAIFLSLSNPVKVRVTLDALTQGPACPPDPTPAQHALPPHVAPAYLAPERIRGEPGVPAGDLYALGAVLFEIVTGRPLFQGSAQEVIDQHLNAPPPVLRRVQAGMPSELEGLFARLLAKVSRFRPSAADVGRELVNIRAMIP